METEDKASRNKLDRRGFLKSVIGLTNKQPARQDPPRPFAETFMWTDLHTGQIGFPAGWTDNDALPGSIMHLVSAAAFSNANLAKPADKYFCTGQTVVNGLTFTCPHPHDELDLAAAIACNCRATFASLAKVIEHGPLIDCAERLGLKAKVADFPAGCFPTETDNDATSLLAVGLDPTLRPTALQHLRLAALIASHGDLPKLHSAEQNVSGSEPIKPSLSDSTWTMLAEGMRLSAARGVCRSLDPDNIMNLSALSSTVPHGQTFASWLIGFFPSDASRYAFLACRPHAEAGEGAMPVARKYLFSQDWP